MRKKSTLARAGIILGALLFILAVLAVWYKITYSMEEAKAFEVNTPESSRTLLIATQGSEFKDSIVTGIVEHFKVDDLYINVIDIHELDRTDPYMWDAICLIHTWEYSQPPEAIENFLDNNQGMDRIVILTTSGDGRYKMKGVDALTGASVLENVPLYTELLIDRLENVYAERLSSK